MDPRFQIYRKPLFSQSTKTLDRDKLGLEENRKLDNLIGNFCKLLSSYFLLPAAFKVLEYLIRKFQANERNVVELMYTALPYHATNEFVRLVQTLELERGGIFAFLSPMQETGVAMPRTLLVQRCLTDRGLLRFILDMGQEMGNARISSRVVMPFYGALLCEVLAASPSLDQSLLEIVFPYLIQALSRDFIAELRAVIYMAIVQLASRVNLSHDSVNGEKAVQCSTLLGCCVCMKQQT